MIKCLSRCGCCFNSTHCVFIKNIIRSQFNYCHLMWMFHIREINNNINRIHKRALRLEHQNNNLPLAELLEKNNSVTIHQRNLQVLATEIFKVKNDLDSEIMKELFNLQNPSYNFCQQTTFKRRKVNTTHYGIQSVMYLRQKIWDMVPNDTKNRDLLNNFKMYIKSSKPNGANQHALLQYSCKFLKIFTMKI